MSVSHPYRQKQLTIRLLAFVLVTLLFGTAVFSAIFWMSP